ncbi:MAG: ribokinase [Cyclobacteriaceae bacterium]|nr:ribokinase [Cyclobacteriaceae bacterium]
MSTTNSILVVGSSNTDMVIRADKFPLPGETILGGTFFMFPGGKGANQAVAAARLKGNVTFIAKVGNDIFGKQAVQQFLNEGINTNFIITDPDHPSGVALITVDKKGENTIVVAPGANGALTASDVQKAEKEFAQADLVLLQLEIPIDTVLQVATLATQHKKKIILNPAPARPLPDDLLRKLFIITPNESEAEALLGSKISDRTSLQTAARTLYDKGVTNVVITLGAEGAYVYNAEGGRHLAAAKVETVDTTAAGDVFNGALAVAISENKMLDEAVAFANRAAAISVTRMGAQASAPYRHEMQ